jgi:hypothetical protein
LSLLALRQPPFSLPIDIPILEDAKPSLEAYFSRINGTAALPSNTAIPSDYAEIDTPNKHSVTDDGKDETLTFNLKGFYHE